MIELGTDYIIISSEISTNKISPIIHYGYCWSLNNSYPNLDNDYIKFGSLVDVVEQEILYTISELEKNQSYYIRSFTITEFDTIFSETKTGSKLEFI